MAKQTKPIRPAKAKKKRKIVPKPSGQGRKETSTKANIDARVAIVTELTIRGYGVTKIMELLAQNAEQKTLFDQGKPNKYRPDLEWNVNQRQVAEYYRRATIEIGKVQKVGIEMELAITKARYEDLIRRAISGNNLHVAARLLRDKSMLLNLSKFVQVDHDGSFAGGKGDEEEEERTIVKLPDGTTYEL